MKKLTILLTMLMATSAFAKEIFFECDLEVPGKAGRYFNITYNKDNSTGSIDSDFMGRAMIYKTTSITTTSDEVVFNINVGISSPMIANFRLSRSTLALSGPGGRHGVCKIIEKDNKF